MFRECGYVRCYFSLLKQMTTEQDLLYLMTFSVWGVEEIDFLDVELNGLLRGCHVLA
jgi:hypothetical protein